MHMGTEEYAIQSVCVCVYTGTLKEVAVAGARASEESAVALIRAALRNNSLQLLDIRGISLATEVRALCITHTHTHTHTQDTHAHMRDRERAHVTIWLAFALCLPSMAQLAF